MTLIYFVYIIIMTTSMNLSHVKNIFLTFFSPPKIRNCMNYFFAQEYSYSKIIIILLEEEEVKRGRRAMRINVRRKSKIKSFLCTTPAVTSQNIQLKPLSNRKAIANCNWFRWVELWYFSDCNSGYTSIRQLTKFVFE